MRRMRGLALLVIFTAVGILYATVSGISAENVTLTLGSWRVDDVEQVQRLLSAFHAQHPNIEIRFAPTNPPDYNAVLRTQLTGGTGPDLMYVRSFKVGQDLFAEGYLEPLTGLDLETNYSEGSLEAWSLDGIPFAVPFMAVSHGIYYNVDLFNQHNLDVPQTWEELLAVAETLQAAGIIPFSNGSKDEWDMNEIVFMNLLPSFIGGREARLEYETGQVPFNDEKMISAFRALQDIAPYLPMGQEGVSYYDAQQLFLLGRAAMFFGGSWDVAFFVNSAPSFEWSIFATPAPEGRPTVVTFHPDAGIGLNSASPHKEVAYTFLKWLTTVEAAQILADEIPGFYPLNENPIIIESKHANDFYALSEGKEVDARFVWPVLQAGEPDGYLLTQTAALAVVKGSMTPEEAADYLQTGLENWFEPTQKFAK
ncbi:MAG: extracellular solute-binding protein [Firmicutes bacterium]|nr:extracellular solute-binding protein [Bacillota bacterium]